MTRERVEFEKNLNEIDLEKEFGLSFKRHCPFCNNDYICVERNINYIDKNFFVSAYAECGVCGARGPLNGEFTQKRNMKIESNVVKKAVDSWNNGVYEKSGEFDD